MNPEQGSAAGGPEGPSTQERTPRLFLMCPRCHATVTHSGQRFCGACGASLFDLGGQHRFLRQGMAILVALTLALFVVGGLLRGLHRALPPSLAGIHVGDTGVRVIQMLGHPQKIPTRIYWQGADGKGHEVAIWEYDTGQRDLAGVAGLTVTMLDGRVHEVGVLTARFPTSDGLHVGDRVGKAQSLYGTGIEEDSIEGLVPTKFIKDGVVVKIISAMGGSQVLAIGIESPRNLGLDQAEAPPRGGGGGEPQDPAPQEDFGNPHAGAPGGPEDQQQLPGGGTPNYY